MSSIPSTPQRSTSVAGGIHRNASRLLASGSLATASRPFRASTIVLLALFLSFGCGDEPQDAATVGANAATNVLTTSEESEGWTLLFDGESFDGWRAMGREEIPEQHWRVEDGTIHKVSRSEMAEEHRSQGADLMTEETFRDFELMIEWKIPEGANSGLKYNVSEEMSLANDSSKAALGFEYQMIDDEGYPEELRPTWKTAGLYDMVPAENVQLNPVGEWNSSRIVFQDNRGEHWLNGTKVAEYDLDSDDFQSRLAESKFAHVENFAQQRSGHIVLQDHNDEAWFRNIKIRDLSSDDETAAR